MDPDAGLLSYRCQTARTINQTQPLHSLRPLSLGGHERDKTSDRVSREAPAAVRVHRAHKVHNKVPPQVEAVLSAAEVGLARRAKAEEVYCVDAEARVGEGGRVLAEVLHRRAEAVDKEDWGACGGARDGVVDGVGAPGEGLESARDHRGDRGRGFEGSYRHFSGEGEGRLWQMVVGPLGGETGREEGRGAEREGRRRESDHGGKGAGERGVQYHWER